jgi:hypothetical protein
MSDIRRQHQLERKTADFATKLFLVLQKDWKGFLGLIGVPCFLGLLLNYVTGKAMDFVVENLFKLGPLGKWIATYPLGLVTLGLIAALAWLIVAAIRESNVIEESDILDANGEPYAVRRVSKAWSRGFILTAVICIVIIGYGGYVYYRTIPLLEQYPLGYVIFDMDAVSGAVTPVETQKGLEAYQFDFRPVRILENTQSRIAIQLPNVLKNHTPLLTGAHVGGDRVTMHKFGAGYFFSDGQDQIWAVGQVLRYEGERIVWVLGFQRTHITLPS